MDTYCDEMLDTKPRVLKCEPVKAWDLRPQVRGSTCFYFQTAVSGISSLLQVRHVTTTQLWDASLGKRLSNFRVIFFLYAYVFIVKKRTRSVWYVPIPFVIPGFVTFCDLVRKPFQDTHPLHWLRRHLLRPTSTNHLGEYHFQQYWR